MTLGRRLSTSDFGFEAITLSGPKLYQDSCSTHLDAQELINRIIKEPDPSNGCEDDEIDGDCDGGIVGNLAKS